MAIKRITPLYQWPKILPELTAEQQKSRDAFMTHWHQVLPKKYGMIENFNHRGAFTQPVKPGSRTLEIGAGLGAHIAFEDLTIQKYVANELRPEMAQVIKERYPAVEVVVGDIQAGLPVSAGSFDRILAVHVLEHLPKLPQVVKEIRRLLKADGYFQAVIPCEGSLAYTLARNISARRVFEQHYGTFYDLIVASEHVNLAAEIVFALKECFEIKHQKFFPLPFIPVQTCNLVISLLCRPK